jgi:hypothetical protein
MSDKNPTPSEKNPTVEDHPTFEGLIPGARFRCWEHMAGAVREEARRVNIKLVTKARKPSTDSELRRGHFRCGGPNVKTPKALTTAEDVGDDIRTPCSFFMPFSYVRGDDDPDQGVHFFKEKSETGQEFCARHNHKLVCLTTSFSQDGATTCSLKRSYDQLDDTELNIIRSYVSGRETVGRVQVILVLAFCSLLGRMPSTTCGRTSSTTTTWLAMPFDSFGWRRASPCPMGASTSSWPTGRPSTMAVKLLIRVITANLSSLGVITEYWSNYCKLTAKYYC